VKSSLNHTEIDTICFFQMLILKNEHSYEVVAALVILCWCSILMFQNWTCILFFWLFIWLWIRWLLLWCIGCEEWEWIVDKIRDTKWCNKYNVGLLRRECLL